MTDKKAKTQTEKKPELKTIPHPDQTLQTDQTGSFAEPEPMPNPPIEQGTDDTIDDNQEAQLQEIRDELKQDLLLTLVDSAPQMPILMTAGGLRPEEINALSQDSAIDALLDEIIDSKIEKSKEAKDEFTEKFKKLSALVNPHIEAVLASRYGDYFFLRVRLHHQAGLPSPFYKQAPAAIRFLTEKQIKSLKKQGTETQKSLLEMDDAQWGRGMANPRVAEIARDLDRSPTHQIYNLCTTSAARLPGLLVQTMAIFWGCKLGLSALLTTIGLSLSPILGFAVLISCTVLGNVLLSKFSNDLAGNISAKAMHQVGRMLKKKNQEIQRQENLRSELFGLILGKDSTISQPQAPAQKPVPA